jgi:hypothetical protein
LIPAVVPPWRSARSSNQAGMTLRIPVMMVSLR